MLDEHIVAMATALLIGLSVLSSRLSGKVLIYHRATVKDPRLQTTASQIPYKATKDS